MRRLASGCIVGDCPVCNEWIYEDEWTFARNGLMIHTSCRPRSDNKYVHIISDLQDVVKKTEKEVFTLKEALEDIIEADNATDFIRFRAKQAINSLID